MTNQKLTYCVQCAKAFIPGLEDYCLCGELECFQPICDAGAYHIQVYSYIPDPDRDKEEESRERLDSEYIHEACFPEYEIANSKSIRMKLIKERYITVYIPREKRDDKVESITDEEWLEQFIKKNKLDTDPDRTFFIFELNNINNSP